jgi:hypothetical protein
MENEQENIQDKLHIRKCPHCKQEYKIKTGIDNWRNLFRMPTLDDWIVLIILALLLVAAYAYNNDTKACRETLNNLDEICMQRQGLTTYLPPLENTTPNYTKFNDYNYNNSSMDLLNESVNESIE